MQTENSVGIGAEYLQSVLSPPKETDLDSEIDGQLDITSIKNREGNPKVIVVIPFTDMDDHSRSLPSLFVVPDSHEVPMDEDISVIEKSSIMPQPLLDQSIAYPKTSPTRVTKRIKIDIKNILKPIPDKQAKPATNIDQSSIQKQVKSNPTKKYKV